MLQNELEITQASIRRSSALALAIVCSKFVKVVADVALQPRASPGFREQNALKTSSRVVLSLMLYPWLTKVATRLGISLHING